MKAVTQYGGLDCAFAFPHECLTKVFDHLADLAG
jgi:hypothetical protein